MKLKPKHDLRIIERFAKVETSTNIVYTAIYSAKNTEMLKQICEKSI